MQSANCYLDEEYIYINFHYDLVIFTRPSWQGHMINCCTDILHFLICVIFVAFLPHFLMQFLMSTISQLCSTLLCCLVSLTKPVTQHDCVIRKSLRRVRVCQVGYWLVDAYYGDRIIDAIHSADVWRTGTHHACHPSGGTSWTCRDATSWVRYRTLYTTTYTCMCVPIKNWTPTKMAIILQRLVISFVTPVQ